MTKLPIIVALLFAGANAGARAPDPAAPAVTTAPAMVSAADGRAAAAGIAMLQAGGNAFDAIAATLLALTVVEPQSSGIGGGGLLVYQPAGAKAPVSFDGRETAPAAVTPALFLDADGKPRLKSDAIPGGQSVGIPGNVAMLALGHAKYGKLPWAKLFAPAIALARGGYDVTPRLAAAIAGQKANLARTREGAALFLNPDGSPKGVGAHIINAPLAHTLEIIAAGGAKAFYTGPNADALVATVTTSPINPSVMTRADLAGYKAKERPPVCGRYRSWKICGMGPPSSGGIAVIAMLGQLERFDMAQLGVNSPVAWHLIAESERLAFADRAAYIADSDFIAVPVAGLIDRGYLKARSKLISTAKTMATAAPGRPRGAPARVAAPGHEIPSTSHFAAADAAGNVASLTSTVEGGFGSGLVSGGYVLNNEMTDFNFAPDEAGLLAANRVQPGKRPRSSMSPTIVYDKAGKVVLVIGAAGGPTIPAQVAKAIIGVLDWKQSVQDAIALPTMFIAEDRLIFEAGPQGQLLRDMQPALAALGHSKISVFPLPLKANGIERVGNGWRGGADPRSEGVALGF